MPFSWTCYFVKGYGFLSFAKNTGKNISKTIRKNFSGKSSQKFIDHTTEFADALKTTSEKAITKFINSRSN